MADVVFVALTLAFFGLCWLTSRPATGSEGAHEPEYVVGPVLALVLLAYLAYAPPRPEKF
jgi:hypothetical protein